MISASNFSVGASAVHINHGVFKKHILIMLCSISLILCQASLADNTGYIVKWKDEKGVTHYGDKIPPQYSNRENSLINKQGITIKQNKVEIYEDKAAALAKIEQHKKDTALLGTFSNAEEIDLARDRNLEPSLMAIKNLQKDRALNQKKCDKINVQLNTFTKAKKIVSANLKSELQACQAHLAKIDRKIAERQLAIDTIRQRFDEDKKRYLYLRGMNQSQ